MNKQTMEDVDVRGKRVLVRVDFNVPLNPDHSVADDTRIAKTIPTIRYLVDRKVRTILMSHLGRPKGKKDMRYSLQPVAERLSQLLHHSVQFVPDCIGPLVERAAGSLKEREVLLLENLRFHAEEEKNDLGFSKSLAAFGDVFVNDAFGAAHRAHASTEGITHFLPSVAGFLLAKEIEYFDRALERPMHPFVAILGGAKVVDKIKVIENLMAKVDTLLIGGAMAYTFLKAQGHSIGNSKFDLEGFEVAKTLLEKVENSKMQFILPEDHVTADKLDETAQVQISKQDIPDGRIGVDIGPKTVERFCSIVTKAKTVVWNGPLGIFEIRVFSQGTREVANYLASLKGATTIIGGGETAQAISELGLSEQMSHVSTGGGASLEYLEGRILPGIQALLGKKQAGCAK